MKVPLTIVDHLERAEVVYGRRTVLVDEPEPVGDIVGGLTAAVRWRRARAQAAALDDLGVAHGERVAIVSHNAARLLTALWGVSAYGRVLVPINSPPERSTRSGTSWGTLVRRCCSSILRSRSICAASTRRGSS